MKKLPIYTNTVRKFCDRTFPKMGSKAQIEALVTQLNRIGYPATERGVKNWFYHEQNPGHEAAKALCMVFDVELHELLQFKSSKKT